MAKSAKVIEGVALISPKNSAVIKEVKEVKEDQFERMIELLEAIDWKLWMLYNKFKDDEED
jgi:hypothetical protein